MSNDDDLYAVLKVDARASTSQIRKAYLLLARENHPDKGAETASFQTLLHAYEVLSDPARRAAYDAELAARRRRDAAAYRDFEPFDFSPMPGFGGFPSFPSFGFPGFQSYSGMDRMDPFGGFGGGFGGQSRGGFGPFGAGFPFMGGSMFGHCSPANDPFGNDQFFSDPFFSNRSRSRRHVDPFEAFFADAAGYTTEEVRPADAWPGDAVTAPTGKNEAVERRMDGTSNPMNKREYVIRDANGNPCGWGYTASWSSSSSSKN